MCSMTLNSQPSAGVLSGTRFISDAVGRKPERLNFSNWQRLQLAQNTASLCLFPPLSSEAFPSSRLPACLPACRHRLDFKFSKHYSEAALLSGQRNNTDREALNFKRGHKTTV